MPPSRVVARRVWGAVTLMAALAIGLPFAGARAQATYDLILRNGRVLDGTGNPWVRADVAITGNRIAAVGDLSRARARRTIDLAGLYLAPGFIDVHSHAAEGGLTIPDLAAAQPLVAQGITTVVVNPDGGGAVDLAAQRQALLRAGLGVNVAQLVSHGSIRGAVLGMQDRAPTTAELERMTTLVRTGMEQGAFGLSSGPYYAPGSYASTEELIALARVAAEYGGVYTSHIRDEGDFSVGVVAAVDEVIRIAREARLPGIVTHMKALGPHVWGFSDTLVRRIERARDEGVEVFADQYPYEASATSLTGAIFPRWAQVGGDTALRRRIDDPAERGRLRADILVNLERRGGADKLQFTHYRADRSIEGQTLAAVAAARGLEPVDAAMELIKRSGASVVSFNMSENDIRAIMRQSWTMTSSDGDLPRMGVGVPHPRSYGTFPRKIRRYVLDERVVDLGAAIRSMTSLPATVFHLKDRGQIREGAIADVVVFDPQRIRDRAEYAHPHQLSEGMVHVLVNGRFVIENGTFTGTRPGEVLSRRAGAAGAAAVGAAAVGAGASTGARASGTRARAASVTP